MINSLEVKKVITYLAQQPNLRKETVKHIVRTISVNANSLNDILSMMKVVDGCYQEQAKCQKCDAYAEIQQEDGSLSCRLCHEGIVIIEDEGVDQIESQVQMDEADTTGEETD